MDLAQSGREKPKRDPKKKVRWQSPDEGMFKINTDASFHNHSMSGSVGLVVRDHLGTMIQSQALWFEHAASALSIEAVAILEGARLAHEKGYLRVIIESDSLLAVNFCNSNDDNRSKLRAICQEVREILRAFSSFSISFIGRDANNAAHLCAKQASSDRRRYLWINYNLVDTLASDCNPIS
jgi:ribonuclease HI